MARWNRTGSATVANGSAAVTGTLTAWTVAARAGDRICFDLNAATPKWYEIAAVASNTSLTLGNAYSGTAGTYTGASGAFAIDNCSPDWAKPGDVALSVSRLLERVTLLAQPAGATDALKFARVNAGGTAYELIGASQLASAAGETLVNVLHHIPAALHAGIANGTNTTDLATYLAAAWAAGNIKIPEGTYTASVFPNFAREGGRVITEGRVVFVHTGTGIGLDIDGGTSNDGVNHMLIGPITVMTSSAAQDAIRVRNINRSAVFGLMGRGAGTAKAGLRVMGCVCTTFYDSGASKSVVAPPAWYTPATGAGAGVAAKPLLGIILDRISPTQQTSYCTFVNPLAEYTEYGIYIAYGLGNTFLGGTAEGCSSTGAYCDTGATDNKFLSVDFEANTVRDVLLGGLRNVVAHCDSAGSIVIPAGAQGCEVIGGRHNTVQVAAGALDSGVGPFWYNGNGTDAGVFTDAGTRTRYLGPLTNWFLRRAFEPADSNAGINRNLLINPAFTVNQRAFAGGALAAGIYGHDRWKAGAAGANYSVSGAVVTLTSGTLQQVVEPAAFGLGSLASKVVTVSVEDLSSDLTVSVGSVSGIITAGSGRQSLMLTLGVGDSGNVVCQFGAAVAVAFARPRLELGSLPLKWSPRPAADEMTLCQRYYRAGMTNAYSPNLADSTTTLMGQQVEWAVPMRAAPTLAFTNPHNGSAGLAILNGSFLAATTSVASVAANGFVPYSTLTSGTVTAGVSYLGQGTYRASAEL